MRREAACDALPRLDEFRGVVGVIVHADLAVLLRIPATRRIVHVHDDLDAIFARPRDELAFEQIHLGGDPLVEPGKLLFLGFYARWLLDAVSIHLEAYKVRAEPRQIANVGLDGHVGTHDAAIPHPTVANRPQHLNGDRDDRKRQ